MIGLVIVSTRYLSVARLVAFLFYCFIHPFFGKLKDRELPCLH
jgi:hypothetical protein